MAKMRKIAQLPLTVMTVLALGGCNEQPAMSQVIHNQHLEAAERFAASTHQLSEDLVSLCESPEVPLALDKARGTWQQVMHSWMTLQGREKGSEEALALSWQIQFWPDKKNTTGRKLGQLLSQDEAWTAVKIAEQSVAVQSVGAVEWFLYEQSTQLQDSNSCQLVTAIGSRLQQSGDLLVDAWQDNPCQRRWH